MSSRRTAVLPRNGPRRLRQVLLVLGVLLLVAIPLTLLVDRLFFPQGSGSPAATGSGVAAKQARSLPPFSGVVLAGANNVTVWVGARQSVIVHADSNLLGRVTTRVRAGTLVIDTTPGDLNARSPMYVAVTVPSLDRLDLRGAGNISVTGIDSRRLSVTLPGAGNIHAAGTTTRLDITISGHGTAELRQLIARDAKALLAGDGTIMLTATRRLGARLSGTGTILFGGDPAHVTQRVTGTGAITPG